MQWLAVDVTSEWVAWASAAVLLIGGAGKLLLDAYRLRRSENKTERADAIAEWQSWVNHLEKRLSTCEESEKECLRQNGDLRIANTELKGDIKLIQSAVQRLQTSTGESPSSHPPVTIIADTDGFIRTVSPGVGPLLHYLPGELVGKNVEILIPEPERAAHKSGLAKVKEVGQPPWSDKVLLVNALTKEGNLVPVSITLTGWQGSKGQWYLSADVRKLGSAGRGPVMDVIPKGP